MITIVKNKVDKPFLQEMLRNGVCHIFFDKKDGTLREMKCTLMSEHLPPLVEGEEKKTRKENDQILTVWDLEKEDWRSMRLDNIHTVEERKEDGE